MLPNIWIIDMYSLMILLGVLVGFFVLYKLLIKRGVNKGYVYSLLILCCFTVIVGFGFAILAQLIIDLFDNDLSLSMTFYGGLLGGALFFIIVYFLTLNKKYDKNYFKEVYKIAPLIIVICHGFGRIGCFCAGCCYGIETDSWLGLQFPGHSHKVYPTQLYEALFLFLLAIPLYFKSKSIYNMNIYMYSYALFRFLIEFIRGDDRGAYTLNMSPAQWISILLVIISTILLILVKKKVLFSNKKIENA